MAPKRIVRKRKRPAATKRQRVADEPPEEAGPDEAAAFMADILASLARMARRHRLDVLTYLLSMALLEAEEHVRLRSKRKLS